MFADYCVDEVGKVAAVYKGKFFLSHLFSHSGYFESTVSYGRILYYVEFILPFKISPEHPGSLFIKLNLILVT